MFWRGILWGGILGTIIGVLLGPRMRQRRTPLVVRGVHAISDTTRDVLKEAKGLRRRVMRKLG